MIKHSLNDGPAVALDALRLEQVRRVAEHLTVGASAGYQVEPGVWCQYAPIRDHWPLAELGSVVLALDNKHVIRYRCKQAGEAAREQARTQARGRR